MGCTALFAWLVPADGACGVTWNTLWILLALAVAGEVFEFAEVAERQPQATEEVREAQLVELQQRVDRGLKFAHGLPSNADAHYVGQTRFAWRGRHADLLVSAKELEELSNHLCRSIGA
jgi:hypothetical protein